MGEVLYPNWLPAVVKHHPETPEPGAFATVSSVLEGARLAGLDQVFIIGTKGQEPYFASSSSDVGQALILFEKFKQLTIG